MDTLLGVSFLMYLTAKMMHSIKICSLWQVILAKILKAKLSKFNFKAKMLLDKIHKIKKRR